MFPLYLFIMDYSQLLNNCEDKNRVLFALGIPKPDTNHGGLEPNVFQLSLGDNNQVKVEIFAI